MIYMAGRSGVVVRNVELVGGSGAIPYGIGVYVSGSNGNTFTDVTASNTGGGPPNTGGIGFFLNTCSNNTIQNCTVHGRWHRGLSRQSPTRAGHDEAFIASSMCSMTWMCSRCGLNRMTSESLSTRTLWPGGQ